ncbi:hypothetical protein F2Q69_00059045 [Brassica cretica]|uniref:Uncharacterized protein n=1 Tax=Brassica cretica TaxID=69181 RepID=A0A8S9RHR2_BRACR|nr:hypothetical protein F2Q69_00059045 [Brassica cretica]
MSSSPSEKKNSDVEMGDVNSALPTPAMHEATPTFIAGFLSFKERLSRRSAGKEGGRIQPENRPWFLFKFRRSRLNPRALRPHQSQLLRRRRRRS